MPVTPARAKKIALSLEDASECPHFDRTAIRTPRKTFATLAGNGADINLMFDPELRDFYCEQTPSAFSPVPGGWGRMGATRCDLKKVSSLIMRRLNDAVRVELLESVPRINRYLGRLIVQGAVEAGTQSLIPRLKVTAENPTVGADLISMTRRFIRREMRTSGLGRWPELYELVVGTPGRPNP